MNDKPSIWDQLSGALQDGWTLARATGTFKSVTLGAAEGIEREAGRHKRLAEAARADQVTNAAQGWSVDLREISRRMAEQAEAEERVAALLRKLGGHEARKETDA